VRARACVTAGIVAVIAMVAGTFTVAYSANHGPRLASPLVRQPDLAWHDGYNHYFVTVDTSVLLAHTQVTAAGHSGLVAGSPGTTGSPWQAVAPNPAYPVVWRPGQPVSVLVRNMRAYPAGTPIERDADGNIRAVIRRPGHDPAGGLPAVARPGRAKLPPGYTASTATVLRALRSINGVRTATEVWGSRFAVTTRLSLAQLRRASPGIRAAIPSHLLGLAGATMPVTGDPDSDLQWYLGNTGQAPVYEPSTGPSSTSTAGDSPDFAAAWARSTGNGVIVADIDTGVDTTNPDLSSVVLPASMDFAVSPPTYDVLPVGTAYGYDHGTAVDGTIAATAGNGYNGAGAAPGVRILALKCSDGVSMSDTCVYAAGEYAISQGARIINMSFGGPAASDPVLQQLVQDAQAAGVLVVAAAGNNSSDNDTTPFLPASFSTSYSNVISVGADDANYNPAYFSDYGATSVELYAPGEYIWTTAPMNESNGYASGTSFAAPLVSAAAAMIWSADPSLTYQQVKADLLGSVTKVPALAKDCSTGGTLDVPAALAQVSEPISYSFAGFDLVQPGEPAAVRVLAQAQAGALPAGQPLEYKLQLAFDNNGTVDALQGLDLPWTAGPASGTVTTGADGSALVPVPGLDASSFGTVPLGLTLPGLNQGTWALIASTVAAGNTTQSYGPPEAVFFTDGTASGNPVSTSTTLVSTTSSPTTSSTTTTTISPPTTAATGTPTTSTGTPSTTAISTTLPTMVSTTIPATHQTTSTTTPPATSTVPTTGTTVPAAPSTTAQPARTTTSSTVPAAGPTTTSTRPMTTTTVLTTTTTTGMPASPSTTSPAPSTTVQTPTTSPFDLYSVFPAVLPTSGGNMEISGANIPPNATVSIGGAPASVTDWTNTLLDVTVWPIAAGIYNVTVTNAAGTASVTLDQALTVTGPPPPGSSATSTTVASTTSTSRPSPSTTSPSTTSTTSRPTTTTTTTTVPPGTTNTTAPVKTTTSTTAAPTTTTSTTIVPVITVPNSTTTSTTTSTSTSTTIPLPPGSSLTSPSGSTPLADIPAGMWQSVSCEQLLANAGADSGSAVPGVVL